MIKIINKTIFILLISINFSYCENDELFAIWLKDFTLVAKNNGISDKTSTAKLGDCVSNIFIFIPSSKKRKISISSIFSIILLRPNSWNNLS